jgi:hypothetical protein
MKDKADFEGFESLECVETHIKIYQMFMHLSPQLVQKTKREINPHLKTCLACREFLNKQLAEAENQNLSKKFGMQEALKKWHP